MTNSSLFETLTQQPGTVHAIFELWPQHALPFTFCAFCVSHFQKYPLRVLNKYRAIHGKYINRIENQSLLESVILIKNFIYFWVVKRYNYQDMSFMHGPTLVLYVIDMWERNTFYLYSVQFYNCKCMWQTF